MAGPQQAHQAGGIHPVELCGQAQVNRGRAVSRGTCSLFLYLCAGSLGQRENRKGRNANYYLSVYYALARQLAGVSVYPIASRVVYLLGEAGNKSLSLTR